jgi:BlaI family transcriptional regulator, penicillinase repressor
MARPKHEHPTPGELEILQVLWKLGQGTVRDVHEAMKGSKPRAYTTVMSLMNTMSEKGLLEREAAGKAFVYRARERREQTLAGLVGDLMKRAFAGSAHALVAQLLETTDAKELAEIRRTIENYKRKRG